MGFLQKYSPQTFTGLVGKKARGIILAQLTGRLSSQIEVLNGNIREKRPDPLRLLLVGHQGSGKSTGARLAAKAHFCSSGDGGGPCGHCPTCVKFEDTFDFNYGSFNVPELTSRTPTTIAHGTYYFKTYDFANINAEEIRLLLNEITAPKGPRFFSAHPEVVVIDEAHRADKPQQNMLLTALDGTAPCLVDSLSPFLCRA
jgi:DNA polymerase III delta prime subunit